MKKIFIIGYYGYDTDQLDGQTVKTRNIDGLIRKWGGDKYEIRYYDTERFKRKKSSIFGILKNAAWCNILIIIPERNSLTYIFPLAYFLSRIFRFEIIHIGIGSKQADFFSTKKHFRKSYISMGRNIKAFLVEVGQIGTRLRTESGFTNTGLCRNFRVHDFKPVISNRNEGLKIVFMARINEEKGTRIIFEIGKYIQEKYPDGSVIIDFYGPIYEDREKFLKAVDANKFISYKGELKPEDIHTTLNSYDVLILPTRYYTEGFPGSILDAYIAGIPVLVSEWAYAHEFVADGQTGFIHDKDDTESFCRSIDLLYSDKERLLKMKHNAWEESKKHTESETWKELEKYL